MTAPDPTPDPNPDPGSAGRTEADGTRTLTVDQFVGRPPTAVWRATSRIPSTGTPST